MECLIKAGALRLRWADRSQLLARRCDSRAGVYGQQQRKMREIGQNSLFGFGARTTTPTTTSSCPMCPTIPQQQLLAWEKELLNLYLSAHPLAHVATSSRGASPPTPSLSTTSGPGRR